MWGSEVVSQDSSAWYQLEKVPSTNKAVLKWSDITKIAKQDNHSQRSRQAFLTVHGGVASIYIQLRQ